MRFGVVDRLPHPVRIVVVPGEVRAARAPTAFGQMDHLIGGVLLDVIAGRGQIHVGAVRPAAAAPA